MGSALKGLFGGAPKQEQKPPVQPLPEATKPDAQVKETLPTDGNANDLNMTRRNRSGAVPGLSL